MNKFFQDIRQSVEKLNDQLRHNNKNGSEGAAGNIVSSRRQQQQQQQGGTRLGGGTIIGSTTTTANDNLLTVTLDPPGSIGCRVEKNEQNSIGACIVSYVEPNSSADRVGLQRGDIIWNAYVTDEDSSNNNVIISYDSFLKLVKSNQRPLILKIRRLGGVITTTAAGTISANAEVRRRAVMAAAEARERAHQQKMKPIEKGSFTSKKVSTTRLNIQETTTTTTTTTTSSDETKRAIEAAKAGEAATVAQLGYNPYEVTKGTGNQAQMAIIATAATKTTTAATDRIKSESPQIIAPLNEAFDHAFLSLVTSNQAEEEIVASLNVIRKLILNATTKGIEEESDKYRRVRLSNPKIQSALVTMQGGLDIMLSCGFELVEDDAETFLVYPMDKDIPDWIPMALQQMNDYVEQKK